MEISMNFCEQNWSLFDMLIQNDSICHTNGAIFELLKEKVDKRGYRHAIYKLDSKNAIL